MIVIFTARIMRHPGRAGAGVRPSAELFVVVFPGSGLVGGLRCLVPGFPLMDPIPKGGVALHQMDPDAFPVRRDAIPRAHFRAAGQGLFTQTARLRRGHDPRNPAGGSRHRTECNTAPADL